VPVRGIVAAHVGELLFRPDMRLGSALAYVGDGGGGIVAPELANAA
jgi:hypothetical protein